eukprot:3199001-Prymnesium_polylepis.1
MPDASCRTGAGSAHTSLCRRTDWCRDSRRRMPLVVAGVERVAGRLCLCHHPAALQRLPAGARPCCHQTPGAPSPMRALGPRVLARSRV